MPLHFEQKIIAVERSALQLCMTTAVQPQFGDSQLANSQLVIVKTSLMLTSTSVSEVDNSDIHLHVQILLQSR